MSTLPVPAQASFLMHSQGVSAHFAIRSLFEQPYPHLGSVEIAGDYGEEHALALAPVLVQATVDSRPRLRLAERDRFFTSS